MEPNQQTAAAALLSAIVHELQRIQGGPPRVPRRAYSLDEVAEMLGTTVKVVRGCVDRGELKTKTIGRALFVPEDSLRRFLQT